MISENVKKIISKKVYNYDHNFNYYSIALGEPFYEEDIITYYDGKLLCIPFFPLNRNLHDVKNQVKNIINNHNAKIIIYWGTKNLSRMKLNGYKLILTEKFDPYNVDTIIDLNSLYLETRKNLMRELRRAKQNNIVINIRHISMFDREHIKLIKEFLDTHEVDYFNIHLINSLRRILKFKTTKIIEARKDQELIGFSILDTFLSNMPVYLFGFYNKNYYGLSTMIYFKMIEYSQKNGAVVLNLGYTMHKNLYKYKKKWPIITTDAVGSHVWESEQGLYKKLVQKWTSEKLKFTHY